MSAQKANNIIHDAGSLICPPGKSMNFYAKQETERKLRQWPYLAYSSGKSTCIQESARLMGQNLVFRTITYLTDFHILELLIGGATCSGSWLCIDALDRLTSIQTSIITPWIQNLQECLKAIHSKNRGRAKACKELVLPYSGKLTVSKSAFMCFTISPGFPGRTDLPDNLVALMRPLNLMRSKMKPILECLFYSAGVIEFKDLARKIDLFTTLWNGLLNTKKKLEMSLWLTILKRLLEEKLIPSEENLGEKIRRLLYGSLTAKDLDYADSILIHVFQV